MTFYRVKGATYSQTQGGRNKTFRTRREETQGRESEREREKEKRERERARERERDRGER